MKSASKGFVDSLTGTDSRMAVYTFATSGPSSGAANSTLNLTAVSTANGANTVKNKIDGIYLPGGNAGGTNWDRGFYQVAQSADQYDVVIIITDGNPTYYSSSAQGPGGRTRFTELEEGIFSANAIKAEGSRVIAFGVGTGVNSPASGNNLRAISGLALGSDYFQESSYSNAAAELRALALGSCNGSLTVVKQVVPGSAPEGSISGSSPAGDWVFDASANNSIVVADSSGTTASDTGAVNFPLTFPGGVTLDQ